MALDTSAQLNAIVQIFAATALPLLKNTSIMSGLVNKTYDARPGDVGSVVNVATPPTGIVANSLTEGNNVQLQQSSLVNVPITVNKHYESSAAITSVADLMTNLPLLSIFLEAHIAAVVDQVETDLFSNYANFTGTSVGTQGVPLTYAEITAAETSLFKSKVQPNEKLSLVVNATQYDQLRQIPQYVNQYQIGNDVDTLKTGAVGTISGFDVYRSTLAPFTNVSGTITNYGMAMSKDAICLVTRPFRDIPQGWGAASANVTMGGFTMQIVMSYNPNNFSTQFSAHILYGSRCLRPTLGVQVIS